jgi:hypothetical protein
MKFRIDIIIFSGLVLATSCRSSQSATADKAGKQTNGNAVCKLADANKPQIKWAAETDEVLKGNNVILPSVYSIFSADSASLKTFFMAAKPSTENSKVDVVVPMPQPFGCKIFSVFQSSTMAPELQKKFPDIVTLKGVDKETGMNDVRLEYNGRMMQGQVTMNGEIYLVSPLSNNDRFYYIVYAKSATNEIKKNFEKKGSTDTDPSKPKPAILKYDR